MSHGITDSEASATDALEHAGTALTNMMRGGRSFSGNERHCCFLNTGGEPNAEGRFANISAVSGLDYPDDGRAVALVDWDHDGRQDMWISNRNAPRLRLMRNEVPGENHFLALRLEGNGTDTNRDGIGARVEIILRQVDVAAPESQAGKQKPQVKTLRAGEGLLAQSSKWLHFGLGQADTIESVTVYWPGGEAEQFIGFEADHRYRLVQGSATAQDAAMPARATKLERSNQNVPPASQVARIRMVQLLTVPESPYQSFDGRRRKLPTKQGELLLVNLWASWCRPCLAELTEFSNRYEELQNEGIEVLALTVEGLKGEKEAAKQAANLAANRKFPFLVGQASSTLLADFNYLHSLQIPLLRELPLPCSFLIDREGRLAAIYKGPVSVDALLEDTSYSKDSRAERQLRSASMAGQSIQHPLVEQVEDNSGVSLRFLLAEYLQHSGRNDQAAQQYADVIKLKPDNSGAHNNLGSTLLELGKVEEAVKHLRRALELNPEHPGAHSNLANALQRQGKSEDAIEHLQQAIEDDPDFAQAHYNLGNTLLLQGKAEEASPHYERALEIDPDYAHAHSNLGIALQRQGKIEEAIEHYRRALQIEPDYADAHYNLGIVLRGQGNTSEAIKHYQQVVRIKPNYAQAHNNLGNAIQAEGKLEESITHYQRAIRIKPDFAEAYNNLGNALLGQKKIAEAIKCYQQALKIQPSYPQAHTSLAVAYQARGDVPKAIQHYKQALVLNRDNPMALNNLAWILATHSDSKLRNGSQAVMLAEYCCGLEGLRVFATLDTLSAAYAEAGRFEEAVEAATEAIEGATAAGNEEVAQALRKRLELYRQGTPYREPKK